MIYYINVKLVAKIKLLPTDKQYQDLKQTLERANSACNYISQQAWETKTFRQFPLHRLTYKTARARFYLAAQVVVRCVAKVADAYKVNPVKQRAFKPYSAISYDSRLLGYKLNQFRVSIWTVSGRQPISFVCGQRDLELLNGQRGESDLVLVNGSFYLFATCEVETCAVVDVQDYLGVDLGVNNIASDSDGNNYSGNKVNGVRHRYARLRARLQAKGTKSAKRLLNKRRYKESRFAKDVNHCISKTLVLKAKDTGRGIALEDLKGIRSRVTVHKSQRRQHHSWSFFDLRKKISYKAEMRGVQVVLVDPRNTSRTCPACGCVDKRNRPSQSIFACIRCGFSGFADAIAAENIRRAAVNQPHVGRVEAKAE